VTREFSATLARLRDLPPEGQANPNGRKTPRRVPRGWLYHRLPFIWEIWPMNEFHQSGLPTIRPLKQKSNRRANDLRPSARAFQRAAPAACWAAEDDPSCCPACAMAC